MTVVSPTSESYEPRFQDSFATMHRALSRTICDQIHKNNQVKSSFSINATKRSRCKLDESAFYELKRLLLDSILNNLQNLLNNIEDFLNIRTFDQITPTSIYSNKSIKTCGLGDFTEIVCNNKKYWKTILCDALLQ